MLQRLFSSRRLIVAALLLVAMNAVFAGQAQDSPKRGRKYKAPPPTSRIEVTVVRATNGKPIENASVIFHPLEDGHDSGNMELKTNDEGKAVMDLLNVGSNVRLQIIAPGFQTYGEDYKVDKDKMAIEIKLKRPAGQYSIYKDQKAKPEASEKPAEKPEETPDAPKADAPKDVPKDKAKPQDAAPPQ